MSRKCPICGKEGTTGKPFSPFCSERCKLIDLGNWASGEYKISRKLETDELNELEAELFINESNKPSNN